MVGGSDLDLCILPSVGVTPRDPGWAGAWWVGVLGSALAMLLAVLPMAGFPKRLPGQFR